jgi:NAD(P)-dependent dehydrogenase (short-subunit alcohol dehydrogenase family)
VNQAPVALVTGANRGLGFEVCRLLAESGYTVVLSGRDPVKAGTASAELAKSGSVHALALDAGNDDSVKAAAAAIEEKFGRLDVPVNNAGRNFDTNALTTSVAMDDVRETLELNLIGAWRVTQAVLPLLTNSTLSNSPWRRLPACAASGLPAR